MFGGGGVLSVGLWLCNPSFRFLGEGVYLEHWYLG